LSVYVGGTKEYETLQAHWISIDVAVGYPVLSLLCVIKSGFGAVLHVVE
jgi:hypothetical protein